MIQMYPGNHKARAVDYDLGYSSNGTEQIAICFEILEGDCTGECITWYGYFTEKAQERTIKALRDLGWHGDNLFTMSLADLAEEVFLVIQPDVDQEGKQRLRVAFINKGAPNTVAMKNRMNDQQKQAFAARMRGVCMHVQTPGSSAARPVNSSAGKPAPKPTVNAVRANFPVPVDDDLPF